MPQTESIRWQAYEHEHIERKSDWFWALGIVAICTALISAIFGNVLFAILILVAAGTFALLARTPPVLIDFELSERGIKVGDVLHHYDDIIAFWVEEHETETPMLLVDTIKWLSPNLIIPIEGVDPKEVRAHLLEYAEEVPMREPFSHKLLEFFGL